MSAAPTPWRVRRTPESSQQDFVIIDRHGNVVASLAYAPAGNDEDSATLIARCVNTHDEVIGVLSRVRDYLRSEEGQRAANLAAIDAALARATP